MFWKPACPLTLHSIAMWEVCLSACLSSSPQITLPTCGLACVQQCSWCFCSLVSTEIIFKKLSAHGTIRKSRKQNRNVSVETWQKRRAVTLRSTVSYANDTAKCYTKHYIGSWKMILIRFLLAYQCQTLHWWQSCLIFFRIRMVKLS